MLSLIAEPSIRKLWLAGAVAGTVRWLDTLASAIFVLHITGSGAWVSVVFVLRLLPMILLGAFVGPLTGKIFPKTILVSASVLLGSTYVVLYAVSIGVGIHLHVVLAACFVGACYQAFEIPVRRTLLADLAGSPRFGTVTTLELSTSNATRMLGPFLGGVYYEALGMPYVYLIGAVGTFLTAVLIWRYSPATGKAGGPDNPPQTRPSMSSDLSAGLHHVRSCQIVYALLFCTVIVNLFGVCYLAALPVIGTKSLALSSIYVGLLQSAEGAGSLLGAFFISLYAKQRDYNSFFYFGSVIYLTSICAVSFVGDFYSAFSFLLLAGFGGAGFGTMQTALLLYHTPVHIRHHLMGILQICIGSGLAGVLLIGFLIDLFSPQTAIAVTSSAGLVLLAFAAFRWPVLWRLRN